MRDVVITSAVRTAIGYFGGTLKDVLPADLAKVVIKKAMDRSSVKGEEIDDVILGCVLQRSDEPNVGRVAALKAGIPVEVPGYTVNRLCASGLQAVVNAAQVIKLNEADIIVAGGVENMSAAPYVLRGARWGYRLRHGEITDTLWEGLTDPIRNIIMGETAENLAEKYKITREEQDEYAARSQMRATRAIVEGKFKEEIVPLIVPQTRGEPIKFDKDEFPRAGISKEKLALYPTVFKKGGTVTPGNSCGINDGAAALIVMGQDVAKKRKIEPMAKILSYAVAAVDPAIMGIGPVYAIPKALKKAGLELKDMDLIELNEAFAAQVLAVDRELHFDHDKLNVNGGAIALGHPVGCSGARILVTLLYAMKNRNSKYGLAALCVGGGQGIAMVVERM
ncbi:MAG: acetyl-CoA C-acetyltransferase [Actinomycetota bacterium]